MRIIIITILIVAFSFWNAHADYKVLNQVGNSCMAFSTVTYLDYLGETSVSPYKLYKDFGMLPETILNHLVDVKEIESYQIVKGDELIKTLEEGIPVLAIMRCNRRDWRNGEIHGGKKDFCHAVVLISIDDKIVGINSWGRRWGHKGLFNLYPEAYSTIIRGYVLEKIETVYR